jgi:hypothetical protein
LYHSCFRACKKLKKSKSKSRMGIAGWRRWRWSGITESGRGWRAGKVSPGGWWVWALIRIPQFRLSEEICFLWIMYLNVWNVAILAWY